MFLIIVELENSFYEITVLLVAIIGEWLVVFSSQVSQNLPAISIDRINSDFFHNKIRRPFLMDCVLFLLNYLALVPFVHKPIAQDKFLEIGIELHKLWLGVAYS